MFAYRRFSHSEPVLIEPCAVQQALPQPPPPPSPLPATDDSAKEPVLLVLPIPHDSEDLHIIAELENTPDVATNYNLGHNINEHAPQGTSTLPSGILKPNSVSTQMDNHTPETHVQSITTPPLAGLEREVVTPPPIVESENQERSACEIVTTPSTPRMDPISFSDTRDSIDSDYLESSTDVQENLLKLWTEDAKNRKYTVPMNNLTKGEIYDLQPHSDIDPYSSLEEVNSSENETEVPSIEPLNKHQLKNPSDTESDGNIPRYSMRERRVRRIHLTDRPQRRSSNNVNYYKMDLGLESLSPKRKPKIKPVPSEPSLAHMAAQGSKTGRIGGRKFFRMDPSSQPSRKHRGSRYSIDENDEDNSDVQLSDNNSNPSNIVTNNCACKSETLITKPWIKKQNQSRKPRKVTKPRPMVKQPREKYFLRSKNLTPKVEPDKNKSSKGSTHFFKTKKHGVPVRTTDRWFKCMTCPEKRGTRREINDHYRSAHPPIRCSVCRELFFTPATLQRHSYYHIHPLQFPCGNNGCDKVFPFTSDRDRHSMVHRTVKTHQCMSKGCGKWFLTKGELVKHAKIHDGIIWKCSKCYYENPDERNLKSHEWKHTGEEECHY